ncbi:MAG TPA: hypothetical protein VFZ62_03595 [Candidatus Saccharimonadales bacterium]
MNATVRVGAEPEAVVQVQRSGRLSRLGGVAVDLHALGVQAPVAVLEHTPGCGALPAG